MKYGAIAYTGNKQKLVEKLLPLFPTYKRFVDVCCGGLSISLNVKGPVLSNDIQTPLIDMFEYMKTEKDLLQKIQNVIEEFKLTNTNKESYLKLVEYYNLSKSPLHLLVIQYYSFSNMIRINANGVCTSPFGKRQFNSGSLKKLQHFLMNRDKLTFSNSNFLELNILEGDFVYIDPPYLITYADYNKFWNQEVENSMYKWLDDLSNKGIKWGMSNVFTHRGKRNDTLIEWSKKYNVKFLDHTYVFSAHTSSGMMDDTQEVYISN